MPSACLTGTHAEKNGTVVHEVRAGLPLPLSPQAFLLQPSPDRERLHFTSDRLTHVGTPRCAVSTPGTRAPSHRRHPSLFPNLTVAHRQTVPSTREMLTGSHDRQQLSGSQSGPRDWSPFLQLQSSESSESRALPATAQRHHHSAVYTTSRQ